MNRTLESMTQMSASLTSTIWLPVRAMMPAKIDICCDISSVAKVTPKMMPRYLLRSPVSIFSATQFMTATPPQPPHPRPLAPEAGERGVRILRDDACRSSPSRT
jgi:hypothetical protein